jgi:hypothetical protein
MTLIAPFPYFGGKRLVADEIWRRFGNVKNYVEPFFGSGAVLLARPCPFDGVETINDADGMVSNFWRALQAAPEEVAAWCDWPVNEADLAARHYWLITEGRDRVARVLGRPDGYDAQVAGWWCWGLCAWIGVGWCCGKGPWQWTGEGWTKDAGRGINRQLPHVGHAGQGINRKLPHVGGGERGEFIREWFADLSARLRGTRICHGDWARVTGASVTWRHGKTAVFLDPPYGNAERSAGVYTEDCGNIAAIARDWGIEAGKHPDMVICLAGYDSEHAMPDDWTAFAWKAPGGFGNQGAGLGRKNATRETLWFSPNCAATVQGRLI